MCLLCCFAAPPGLHAQDTLSNKQKNDSTRLVVRRLDFKGNDHVKDNTLELLINTHTNREFLGIPGFTPWYYLWRLTGTVGEEPARLNRETVKDDLERIDRYYNSIGFLETTVDVNINKYDKNKARVTFLIKEGERAHIQTIAYSGLPPGAFKNKEAHIQFLKDSPLTKGSINDTTYKAGIPYIENELDKERERIVTFLNNNGYAAAQPDSVTVLIKRRDENKYKLDALYLVHPGQKYTFGSLHIQLAGPGGDTLFTYQQKDTLQGKPYTTNGEKIYLAKEKSAQTDFSLLSGQLFFRPGATYNNKLYIQTVNEFQNLPMLSIRQFGLGSQGSGIDYSQKEIPVYFKLQTIPKHSLSFNVFGMKRYGYGSGAGLTYTNNNLFGNAERLQLSVSGSFEYVASETFRDIPNSSALDRKIKGKFFQSFEARLDYSLPRLTFPFGGLDDNLFFANARTRYSLTYGRSDQLLFDVNANIGFNLRYEVQHSNRFSSFFDLLDLQIIDTTPTRAFEEALREQFADDPLALQQILEDFRPQISSILRYTFRSARTDLIKRNYGYFSEYSISLGGNLPYLVDEFVITPDTLEGNLPSPARLSTNSLAYSRFIKFTADYRRYIPISPSAVFAFRGFAGYAIPYGQSRTIPLNQRFFAGGSNDIRGWSYYSLGPGSIPLNEVAINGGEIKLLAQTELRQIFLEDFISTNWIFAWFADAGNVWYGPQDKFLSFGSNATIDEIIRTRANLERGKFKFSEFYKQIAVGSGVGLRLDFNYLVARFDFAFRIHDLQKGWFENGHLYFSFGIGHSF